MRKIFVLFFINIFDKHVDNGAPDFSYWCPISV